MRIATLQFAPKLGEVSANIDRANAILAESRTSLNEIDLLVLPELAFSGYNHPSLEAIFPFLEPTCSGPSTAWAKTTAARLNCIVSVGYPEYYTPTSKTLLPTSSPSPPRNTTTTSSTVNCSDTKPSPQETKTKTRITAYNSTITISPHGAILAHYRKTHLYYTDETWAAESPSGFLTTTIPIPATATAETKETKIAFGICMDLNPHHFTAPWDSYEFARSALRTNADIVVVSMAWLTSLSTNDIVSEPDKPDWTTFEYWVGRLMPLITRRDGDGETGREVVVVMANRCGEEPGGRDHLGRGGVRYAGSSWVGTVGGGKVRVWGCFGRGVEGVLVVDLNRKGGRPACTFSVGGGGAEGEDEDEDEDEDEESSGDREEGGG